MFFYDFLILSRFFHHICLFLFTHTRTHSIESIRNDADRIGMLQLFVIGDLATICCGCVFYAYNDPSLRYFGRLVPNASAISPIFYTKHSLTKVIRHSEPEFSPANNNRILFPEIIPAFV